MNTLSEYTYFIYQKTLLHTRFCLFLKSVERLHCILKSVKSDDATLLSRVLKRNVGQKWEKYIIKKSRRSYSSETASKKNCMFFFLFEIYDFYHINKDIIELPLQPVCLRVGQRSVFSLGVTDIWPLYAVSRFIYLIFLLILSPFKNVF